MVAGGGLALVLVGDDGATDSARRRRRRRLRLAGRRGDRRAPRLARWRDPRARGRCLRDRDGVGVRALLRADLGPPQGASCAPCRAITTTGRPAAEGYYAYFGSRGGEHGKGYYSFDLGDWHVVALNSNLSCGEIPCSAGSEQERWLRADLAANPADCTLAVIHHPLFSAVKAEPAVQPLWEALHEAGADIVLSGHGHNYQRFAPLTPSGERDDAGGIRQIVVGTGGRELDPIAAPAEHTEAWNDDTWGVLELTLDPGGYAWRFVPVAGRTFTDQGSAECNGGGRLRRRVEEAETTTGSVATSTPHSPPLAGGRPLDPGEPACLGPRRRRALARRSGRHRRRRGADPRAPDECLRARPPGLEPDGGRRRERLLVAELGRHLRGGARGGRGRLRPAVGAAPRARPRLRLHVLLARRHRRVPREGRPEGAR